MEAKTFREAYEVLQRHAATLREQDEPNIDDLLDIVNESVAAYKVCKLRIDAVEKALEEALVGVELDAGARTAKPGPGGAGSAKAPPARRESPEGNRSDFEASDDDIPF